VVSIERLYLLDWNRNVNRVRHGRYSNNTDEKNQVEDHSYRSDVSDYLVLPKILLDDNQCSEVGRGSKQRQRHDYLEVITANPTVLY
jgi:hypothetical protein